MSPFYTHKSLIFPLSSHKSHTLQFGENDQPQTRKGNNTLTQTNQAVMDGAGSQGCNPKEYDPGNQQSNSLGKMVNPSPTLI